MMRYRVFGFVDVDGSPQERELVVTAADEAYAKQEAAAQGMTVASVERVVEKPPPEDELVLVPPVRPVYTVLGMLSLVFWGAALLHAALALFMPIAICSRSHVPDAWLHVIGWTLGGLLVAAVWLAAAELIRLFIQMAEDTRRTAVATEQMARGK
jgi:hypothetical protein